MKDLNLKNHYKYVISYLINITGYPEESICELPVWVVSDMYELYREKGKKADLESIRESPFYKTVEYEKHVDQLDKEIMQAANSMVKNLGVSYEEAITMIVKGREKGFQVNKGAV